MYFDLSLSLFPPCGAEVDTGVVPKPCSMCVCVGLGGLLIIELCSGTAASTLQEQRG